MLAIQEVHEKEKESDSNNVETTGMKMPILKCRKTDIQGTTGQLKNVGMFHRREQIVWVHRTVGRASGTL